MPLKKTSNNLSQIKRFINKDKHEKLEIAISLNLRFPIDPLMNESYLIGTAGKQLSKCSSKEIRMARVSSSPETNFKIGLDLSTKAALTWLYRINKLTSTKHKTNILRVAHGDVYTKVKMLKFGLTQDDRCPRCDESETLQHKIYNCEYTNRIWKAVSALTKENLNPDPLPVIMGASLTQTLEVLTIKAEIIGRILGLPQDQSYLIHPKHFVRLAIESLIKKERKKEMKDSLRDILSEQ